VLEVHNSVRDLLVGDGLDRRRPMPAGRREKRLDSAISTPWWCPPAVLCSAAILAKSPTFSVSTV